MKKASLMGTIAVIFLTACNNKSISNEVETTSSIPIEALNSSNTVTTDDTTTTIILKSDDRMRFDQSEINVRGGQSIKLTLEHTGQMPKSAMGHNFVLLKQGVNLSEFGREAAKGQAPDYELSAELLNDVIAHTKMIGGGESVTIEFPAPEKGQYEFLCSFPGHAGTMRGILNVN